MVIMIIFCIIDEPSKPMGPDVPSKGSTVDVRPRPNGGSVTSIITEIQERE